MTSFIKIRNGDEVIALTPDLYVSAEQRIVEIEDRHYLKLTMHWSSGRTAEAPELPLAPYAAGDYWLFAWNSSDSMLVIGAEGAVFLDLGPVGISATIPFEGEEAKLIGVPLLVQHGDAVALVTETRVSYFAGKQLRWIWSTRVSTHDWCEIAGAPVFEQDQLLVPVKQIDRDFTVALDRTHGLVRPAKL